MACSTGSRRTPCRINSQSAKLICRAAALDTRQLSRVITDFPSHASRPSRNAARPQTLNPAMRDPSPSSAGLPASSPRARKWKNGSPSLGRTGPNSCERRHQQVCDVHSAAFGWAPRCGVGDAFRTNSSSRAVPIYRKVNFV